MEDIFRMKTASNAPSCETGIIYVDFNGMYYEMQINYNMHLYLKEYAVTAFGPYAMNVRINISFYFTLIEIRNEFFDLIGWEAVRT